MEARGKRTVSAEQAELLRQIPSVDELLAQPRLAALSKRVDRNLVVEVARTVLADLRALRGRFELDSAGPQRRCRRRAHQHRSRTNSFALAAAGHQCDRSDSAHEPGPGAAAGNSRGRIPPHCYAVQQSRIRPRSWRARQARRAYRRVADAP